jgi:hypothetical protein
MFRHQIGVTQIGPGNDEIRQIGISIYQQELERTRSKSSETSEIGQSLSSRIKELL